LLLFFEDLLILLFEILFQGLYLASRKNVRGPGAELYLSKFFDIILVVKKLTKHIVEPNSLSRLVKVGGSSAMDDKEATILVPLSGEVAILDLGLSKSPELI
jgi:hypothetical protein